MNRVELTGQIARELKTQSLDEVELYSKSGRTRRMEIGPQGKLATFHREAGWAVRASGRRASFLSMGTGQVRPEGPWPEADGYPILLPVSSEGAGWEPPADLEAPLAVEAEVLGLLESCERELLAELPGSTLLRGVLEDGASETSVASTRGVDAEYRGRAATLFLEVVGPAPARLRVVEFFAEREARKFRPQALARRIADRVVLMQEGRPAVRDRGDFLLGPWVGARILEGLVPLFVGPGAVKRAGLMLDRTGRLASRAVSVIDDGGLAEGLLSAPFDGEGVPTRRLTLVEKGIYRRPLLAWWQEDEEALGAIASGAVTRAPPGCVRRAGWRDLPRLGPSHLFFAPDPKVSAASLLSAMARGYYFTEVVGEGLFDFEENRFRLPVAGFQVQSGRPIGRVSGACLQGRLSGLLQGTQQAARDLSFVSSRRMIGSPTLLVNGVELASL